MARKNEMMIPDLLADPFGERSRMIVREPLQLLGGEFRFESNSRELLRLVDAAYAGVPPHFLSRRVPRFTVRLLRLPGSTRRVRTAPPPVSMLCGGGLLGGATDCSSFVALSPRLHGAVVAVSSDMLRFPYHTRYELIEFAVFTLAARAQQLVSLHAACVGVDGRALLLMGPTGAGKSTVSLFALLQGLEFISEDSVFVSPRSLATTGIANFIHVRHDTLRWLGRDARVAAIRRSPVIQRRSGQRKFEVDLRRGGYRLAPAPLPLASVVFLSPQQARGSKLLAPLSRSETLARLTVAQAYAASQPQWSEFTQRVLRLGAFELRRGSHPAEAIGALREVAASSSSSSAAGRTRDT
jgi:hypothetical protein